MSKYEENKRVLATTGIFKLFVSHKDSNLKHLRYFVKNYDASIGFYDAIPATEHHGNEDNNKLKVLGTVILKFSTLDTCLKFLQDVFENHYSKDFPIASAYPTEEAIKIYHSLESIPIYINKSTHQGPKVEKNDTLVSNNNTTTIGSTAGIIVNYNFDSTSGALTIEIEGDYKSIHIINKS